MTSRFSAVTQVRRDAVQVRCDVTQVRSDVVRHHDGRVEGQDEDHPVPDGLERRVMEYNVMRSFGRFLSVLRQHFSVKVEHLRQHNIIYYHWERSKT